MSALVAREMMYWCTVVDDVKIYEDDLKICESSKTTNAVDSFVLSDAVM
jgi:hypothetical protein